MSACGSDIDEFARRSDDDEARAGRPRLFHVRRCSTPGPHLDVTGPYLEGKASIFPQMTALDAREQARRTVAFWAGEGATSFKAYMNIRSSKLMQS
jgi:hypothetical protein